MTMRQHFLLQMELMGGREGSRRAAGAAKAEEETEESKGCQKGGEDVQGEGEAARKELLQQAEDAEMGVEAGQGQGEEVEEGF